VDANLRPMWKELLDHLAPLPTGGDPLVWIRALPPIFRGRGDGRPDGNTMPQWFFDLCTLENGDPETMKIANATMDGYLRGPGTRPGVLSKVPVTAAMMGRAEAIRYLLPNQLLYPDRAPVLANRLDQREGVQTTNAQRLGRVADTLHNALLQSVAAGPAREPVIRVFPAWPGEWDAAFTLRARGAFLVSSSMKAGRIEFVQIKSQLGGPCRLRNPWPDMTVTLSRDAKKADDLSGSLLVFATKPGETIGVTPAPPPAVPDAATAAAPQAHLDYPPGQAPRFWSVATAETIMARWPDYNRAYHASWTYVHGYTLCGFDMLYRATGDQRYYDFIQRYIDQHIDENGAFRVVVDGRGRERATAFGNQDNMMTGRILVLLYEYTKDPRYRKAADTIRRALDDYPRNRNGGLWHARSMHGQWWIDGIFMSQMFLTRYGQSVGDTTYCWDEATRQITAYAKTAEKGHTGLMVHGTYESGHGDRECRWADPNTGLSPEVWSEGLGWYALVLVETLTGLPKDHPRRAEMEDIFRRLAAALKRTQDVASGRWFQVVDKGDRPDNWTDTSGSAMFTCTIQKGIEIGLLDPAQYGPVVRKGYRGILENARINDRGLVDIYSACDGVGVQTSYDRYINYQKSVNAKEAVAGFLWAAAIVERPELEKLRTR
jgi:rhamnogalacturonyl hydrolase YesR